MRISIHQGSEILAALSSAPAADAVPLKKKDKQELKRSLFLERLQSSQSPYSKSHERRAKRKAQNEIGGGLRDITAAITAVEDAEVPEAVKLAVSGDLEETDESAAPRARRAKHIHGQIGEGKGAPLTEAQRKRALYVPS